MIISVREAFAFVLRCSASFIRAEEHVADEADEQDSDDDAEDIAVAGEQAAELIDDQGDRIGRSSTDSRWQTTSTLRCSSRASSRPIAAKHGAHSGLKIRKQ